MSFVILVALLGHDQYPVREWAEAKLSSLPATFDQWRRERQTPRPPEIDVRMLRVTGRWGVRLATSLLPRDAILWPDVDTTRIPIRTWYYDEDGVASLDPEQWLYRENIAINNNGIDYPTLLYVPWRKETRNAVWRALRDPRCDVEKIRAALATSENFQQNPFAQTPPPIYYLWTLCHAPDLVVRPPDARLLLRCLDPVSFFGLGWPRSQPVEPGGSDP